MAKLGTRTLSWFLAFALLASVVTPFAVRTKRADAVIAGIAFTPGVFTVNSVTQYNVAFTVGQGLQAGVATISIAFPSGVVLPASIDKSRISVNGIPLTTDPLVTPSTRVVVVTVPATTPAGVANPNIGCGVDNICANADDPVATAVAVFFSQLAGITNPAAGGPAGTAGAATSGSVTTSVEAVAALAAAAQVVYTRTLAHSVTSGARGTAVTTTASGYVSGSTATLWNDNGAGGGVANDFIRNGGESVLGSAVVATTGIATISWTANVPPLAAGANASIRAWDNAGNVIPAAGTAPPATFTVLRSITLSPATGPVGTTVTLTGRDFTAAEAIDGADADAFVNEGVTIAGLACGSTVAGSLAAGATGVAVAATAAGTLPAATFCVVPAGINTGAATVRVFTAGGAAAGATSAFTVQGAPVSLSPSTGVPGTIVTVSASGLTGGGAVAQNAVTIGGAGWNNAGAIALDAAGNMPATALTIPAAQAAGTYTVVVTDAAGLQGSATLTVPARNIAINNTSSKRNSVITVTGSGYSRSASVTINYNTGVAVGLFAAGATIGSTAALTDANGNFTANLTVPVNAAINSSNTIVGVDPSVPGAPTNANTVDHQVPAPVLSVNSESVSIGSSLTISGDGYPAFTALTALAIGGLGVLPAAAVNTDSDGRFSVTVTVPQQNTGTAPVAATVGAGAGAIVGTRNIALTAAVVNVATQLQGISQQLQRAWAFDNATGRWKLYDPSAPAAANDLRSVSAGDAVVIVAREAGTLTTGTFTQPIRAGLNIFGWR